MEKVYIAFGEMGVDGSFTVHKTHEAALDSVRHAAARNGIRPEEITGDAETQEYDGYIVEGREMEGEI